MPDTVAGLFRSRSEAQEGLRKLKQAGFSDDQVSVATPRRRGPGRYLAKVGGGIVVGLVLGLIAGAVAAGILPGPHALLGGTVVYTFVLFAVAGALAGGVGGFLVIIGASGPDELFYEQEVESGRTLVSVAGPRLEEAIRVLTDAGAIESEPVEAPLEPHP